MIELRLLTEDNGAELGVRVIRQLLEAGQVDELRIETKPVLLEGGTRLLEDIGCTIDLAVSSVTLILQRVSVGCRVA